MKYTILNSDNHNSLAVKVKDLIKDGWVPQGGVSSSWSTMHGSEYAQAMVKPIVEKWVKQY